MNEISVFDREMCYGAIYNIYKFDVIFLVPCVQKLILLPKKIKNFACSTLRLSYICGA